MTTPEQNNQQTDANATNAQPPHANTQPSSNDRTPVVVNTAASNDVNNQLSNLARTVAGLPEQIVNGFREATQRANEQVQQTPSQVAQQTPQTSQQGGQNTQAPGSDNTATESAPKSGPKVSRFASWWYRK